jgi:hypothetical protein
VLDKESDEGMSGRSTLIQSSAAVDTIVRTRTYGGSPTFVNLPPQCLCGIDPYNLLDWEEGDTIEALEIRAIPSASQSADSHELHAVRAERRRRARP